MKINFIKLNKSKNVLIYWQSVRYICFGVKSRYLKFTITDYMHDAFLAACD